MSYFPVFGFVYLVCIKFYSSAPVSETFLNEFLTEMKANKCLLPKEVQLPVPTTETLEVDALSSHLQSCSFSRKELSKPSLKLCEEVFALLRSIACTQSPVDLPEIKVEFSTQVCADFKALGDSVPDGLLKYLSDPFSCDLTCSGINNTTCQMLLWSYQVDKSITDYIQNEKQSKALIVDKSATPTEDVQNSLVNKEAEYSKDPADKFDPLHVSLTFDPDVKPEGKDVKVEKQDGESPDPNLKAGDVNVKAKNEVIKSPDQVTKTDEETKTKDGTFDGELSDPEDDKPIVENLIPQPNDGTETIVDNETEPAKTIVEKKQTKPAENHGFELSVKTFKPQSTASVISVDTTAPEDPQSQIANKEQKDDKTLTRKDTTVHNEKPADKKILTDKPQKESGSTKQMSQVTGKADLTSVVSIKMEQTVVEDKEGKTVNAKSSSSSISVSPAVVSTKMGQTVEVKKEKTLNEETSSSSVSVSPELESVVDEEIPLTEGKDPDQYAADLEKDEEDYQNGKYVVPLDEQKNKKSKPSIPQIPVSKGSVINFNDGRGDFSMGEQPYGHEDIKLIASFPEQEDTHFFFYFLSLVLMLMAGYLIFHNKQKIIALIVEGRHERGRRRSHGASYKKLDTK